MGPASPTESRTPSLAGATLDASELLDVDVDQFAGDGTFVALGGLEAQASQAAHPDPGQDPRDGRQRPVQQLGDLGSSEAHPAQRGDRLDGGSSVRLATIAGAE